ncbi:hypothetical protein MRB53_013254 [Persea americana]|uniref:Uncharacterized protein n=1 Tax=Persea americana TaxID=3435 RepID=A0ACC2K837_PERAE|nr:hypothetical protein MRB53_013254 [Persea americana]
MLVSATNFTRDFDITWGDGCGKIRKNGTVLTLSLDGASGSGFQSKNEFLFGQIDMRLKLVPGNSAGTVTAYYLSSRGLTWDEIDFEFLGNLSGEPYTVHTNVFTRGKGNREQHFSVDGIPIRVFKNFESMGVPFPNKQPMRIYSSLWNADDWAKQGGRIKTDWTKAPFTVAYRKFRPTACVWYFGAPSCTASKSPSSLSNEWMNHELDSTSHEKLRWVQKYYMIYNYCADLNRFPQGLPSECKLA